MEQRFQYRCKVCGHVWRSQRVTPICYGLRGTCMEAVKIECVAADGADTTEAANGGDA